MNTAELKNRTKKFALNILDLLDDFPKNNKGYIISRQLGRCATSVGANYRSAARAKSKADFIAKIGIVEEEVDESCYWLEIAAESGIMNNEKVKVLLKEANELTAIFTATGRTSKENNPIKK